MSTLTVAQLQAFRDDLISARLSGLREIEDQNGERVQYKTDAEMARAIEAADREIARLQGTGARTIKISTSKGT